MDPLCGLTCCWFGWLSLFGLQRLLDNPAHIHLAGTHAAESLARRVCTERLMRESSFVRAVASTQDYKLEWVRCAAMCTLGADFAGQAVLGGRSRSMHRLRSTATQCCGSKPTGAPCLPLNYCYGRLTQELPGNARHTLGTSVFARRKLAVRLGGVSALLVLASLLLGVL